MENIGVFDRYAPVNGFLIIFDFLHIVPPKYYALAETYKVSRLGTIVKRGGNILLH